MNNEKQVKFKSKKKASSFFKIIFTYLSKRPLLTTFLFTLVILSALCGIFSPKIIQNIMLILTAPTSNKNNSPLPPEGVPVQKMTIFSDDGINYYTKLFGLKMFWQTWIYLQLGLLILMAVFTFLSNFVAGRIGRSVEIELRNNALEKLVKQDISYYSDKKIGEILTKIISDTQIIGEQTQQVPVTAINAFVTFFGSLIMMFTIDAKLTWVVLGTMLVIVVTLGLTFGVARKLVMAVRKEITNINGDVTDRISTIRLIKSSGTEKQEVERFKDQHKVYFKKSQTMILVQSIIITVLIAGITSIQILIVISAALFYNNDPQTIAIVLPAFISSQGTMIGPIMQLTRLVFGIIQASTSAERIQEIIGSKSRMNPFYEEGKGIYIDKIEGDIILKDLEFRYPEKPEQLILPKFNFTFEQGKSYAFVGETGSGKSTIAKLLLRFYDPSAGSVIINGGIDLKDVKLSTYLKHVGYVEQEPQILFGTVLDNIKYGNGEKTDEEAIEAAKKANLHEIINSWPEGYNTILGERGFMLSGGQKQRLVIARMFLKDPQLLILDEATSALDNIVEKEIQKNINELMKGRTSVSIAHRLSTIKNVDQIIVISKNEGIAQIGTFNELKEVPGHFKDLYEAGLMS
ncbi:ABC transporter ATP-binding protein [Spiroplasma endosymbiont of Crioceris asparagi]|uniref:ABC transporter ATP-binding protein n=1 Tax=Spiroplasma endosymbiont of Crioceris asparagi TaxID=3066286 RepID=UPI0030CAF67C